MNRCWHTSFTKITLVAIRVIDSMLNPQLLTRAADWLSQLPASPRLAQQRVPALRGYIAALRRGPIRPLQSAASSPGSPWG